MDIRKVPNSNVNDKYYYHQLEFISNEDIKKENNSTLLDIPGKARELFSSVNNLSQKKVLSNLIYQLLKNQNNKLKTMFNTQNKDLFYAEVTTGFEQDIIIYGDTIENNIDDIIEKINN